MQCKLLPSNAVTSFSFAVFNKTGLLKRCEIHGQLPRESEGKCLAKKDSNETCLMDGAKGSFNHGNTSERPTMHQVFADISAGMLEEMLPDCLE